MNNVISNESIKKLIITKEEYKKYFNEKKIISQEEYRIYLKEKNNLDFWNKYNLFQN